MNPKLQRIAIAQACGWTFDFTAAGCHIGAPNEESYWDALDGRPGDLMRFLDAHKVPDYLADLNAMHEAENAKIYDEGGQSDKALDYLGNLVILAECGRSQSATAPQRAEALLRTLNLWTNA
jgi:hypothetical protein